MTPDSAEEYYDSFVDAVVMAGFGEHGREGAPSHSLKISSQCR